MNRTSRPSTRSLAGRSLLAGISAGLRSMTPMGVFASTQTNAPASAGWKDWPLLRSGFGRALLRLAWAGEIVGDKMPGVPPRTEPGPLGGRVVLGSLAGLAIASSGRGTSSTLTGMLAGATGALVGSYGGYTVRTGITRATGCPDLPVALVEDAVAWAIARKAIGG